MAWDIYLLVLDLKVLLRLKFGALMGILALEGGMVYSIGGINSAVFNTTTRLNPVRMVVRLSVVFDNLYH